MKTTWCWTNWTFGIWYAVIGKNRHWGIDLGPLEIHWKAAK